MGQKVRDVMTGDPVVLHQNQPISDGARIMRDRALGSVLVSDGENLYGLVTDRDIVVRAVADALSPDTPLARVCSADVVAVDADAEPGEAVRIMRENAVRRLPVVDNGEIAGMVSLGDLAVDRDRDSLLGSISAAEPNI